MFESTYPDVHHLSWRMGGGKDVSVIFDQVLDRPRRWMNSVDWLSR